MSKYYSIKNLITAAPAAKYYLVYGERSNGKTYSVLEYGIERYLKGEGQLAVIRRWRDDIKGQFGSVLFDNHVGNHVVEDLSEGKYNTIIYSRGMWYLALADESGKITKDETPFAYAFAISSSEHYKSLSYPNITTALFDEFLTRGMYLPDEFVMFANLISTIVRDRDNLKIFLCGNTVNQYCPYFREMGLTRIKAQKPGTIDIYKYGETKLQIAVEYAASSGRSSKKSDVYFAFDNPQLKMITEGAWEMAIYPHLPERYDNNQIIFEFFIIFDGDTLHCEMIEGKNQPFIYVHRKTTPIQSDKDDWVYSEQTIARPNWRRNIMKENDQVSQAFRTFYNNSWIFYQDNEIGEIMRNYISTC